MPFLGNESETVVELTNSAVISNFKKVFDTRSQEIASICSKVLKSYSYV